MNSSGFNFKVIHLSSVDSTNIYALEQMHEQNLQEGSVVRADFQERGKGQRESSWHSDPAKNLLFSLILNPRIEVDDRFDISKFVALGIKECLDTLAVGKVEVKWPNDILIEGEKVAGILIENSIQGLKIGASIIGIGLNVNQTIFPKFKRNATSILLSSGSPHSVEEIFDKILNSIYSYYKNSMINRKELHQSYINSLYGYGIPMRFIDVEGEFTGVIIGVLPNGNLQVNKNGKLKSYEVKEIEFLN